MAEFHITFPEQESHPVLGWSPTLHQCWYALEAEDDMHARSHMVDLFGLGSSTLHEGPAPAPEDQDRFPRGRRNEDLDHRLAENVCHFTDVQKQMGQIPRALDLPTLVEHWCATRPMDLADSEAGRQLQLRTIAQQHLAEPFVNTGHVLTMDERFDLERDWDESYRQDQARDRQEGP